MRFFGKRTIIGLAILLGLAASAALLYRSNLYCWVIDGIYDLQKSTYIEVDVKRTDEFLTTLEQFAQENDMSFAINRYAGGHAGFRHDTFVAELFDCTADIIAENNQARNLFGLHISSNPSGNADEFKERRLRFETMITQKFPERPAPEGID